VLQSFLTFHLMFNLGLAIESDTCVTNDHINHWRLIFLKWYQLFLQSICIRHCASSCWSTLRKTWK
jgi:hypothetical protein